MLVARPEVVDMQTSAFIFENQLESDQGSAITERKIVVTQACQIDRSEFGFRDISLQVSSEIPQPSHHSSLEEHWVQAPSDVSNEDLAGFFSENRQIKDMEELGRGTQKAIINKYNEVVVSSLHERAFASKYLN